MSARICDWCRGPIPATCRRDALTCSKRCRQARHRFRSAIAGAPVAAGQPRRLAYADPPYPGKAGYYVDHPDYGGEVDHAALIASLSAEFDAWALSTSAEALQDVLALCPPGVRVAAWFRGERPNAQAQLPQNAWEPVIYAGDIRRAAPEQRATRREARPRDTTRRVSIEDSSSPGSRASWGPELVDVQVSPGRRDGSTMVPVPDGGRDTSPGDDGTRRGDLERRIDTLIYTARPRLTDPDRVIGAKPAAFCRWLFDLLGATPADTFTDMFPGSGGVSRAWSVFCEGGAVA